MSLAKATAVVLACTLALGPAIARSEITAEQVKNAIDQGIAFLSRQQKQDGSWPDRTIHPGGVTALCTLALLNAGVEPDDERIQEALAYLRRLDRKSTYAVSLQTMVFAAASPKKDLGLIRTNVAWLLQNQTLGATDDDGGWSYPGPGADNSNSQFAVLALHEAERAGAEIPVERWERIRDFWLRRQCADGSWGYGGAGGGGTGSMTCAGVGSLVIAETRLAEGDAKVVGDQVQCCQPHANNRAIEDGINWLGRNFSVHANPGGGGWLMYYLYALERVGRLTARRFFTGPAGDYDWYRLGSEKLVNEQDRLSGFWRGTGGEEDDPYVATSFALLFLGKGRRPVLMVKLMHGPRGNVDWNNHRSDVANLTSYVESRWKRDLSWQIVDVHSAKLDDLMQSPVLFFNGRRPLNFTDAEIKTLREYVDQGGFLFIEACCEGKEFDSAFRDNVIPRMFPEQEYRLRMLDRDHPIWTIEEPVDPNHVKPLWGLDVGCRTSVVYCPDDLSCFWELSRAGRLGKLPPNLKAEAAAANSLGINVLAYATNRELKYKYEIPQHIAEKAQRDPFERAKLYVSTLRHPGGWDQAPAALTTLLDTLASQVGLRVNTEKRDVALSEARLFDYHMVFMHGRNTFRLTDSERTQLRTFIARGGIVFANSICGSEEFTASFRREMASVFPEQPFDRIPTTHPMFTSELGGFELKLVSRREPHRTAADAPLKTVVRQVEPELYGIKFDDRYGVVFSPFDLSCALENHASVECSGYLPQDAARIGINVIMYSLND
jgi:hypothetical protein